MSARYGSAGALLSCILLMASTISILRAAPPSQARIGVLNSQGAPISVEAGLREGLRALGYVEGKNLIIEWRRTASNPEEMHRQAANLAQMDLDLIISMGTPATRAALDAGAKTVVFWVGDPIAAGFAASLSKPGGKATGVSVLSTDLNRKRLEFLRALAPQAKVVGYLTNASNPLMAHDLAEARNAAHMLGLQLIPLSAQNVHDLAALSPALTRRAVDALIVVPDLGLLAHRAEVARLIREAKIPAILPWKEYHDVGVLMSYAPDNRGAMRLLAMYVDKIANGSKPAELPVEQISRYELVIDLRVAREMGTPVPPELLLRADEVIR